MFTVCLNKGKRPSEASIDVRTNKGLTHCGIIRCFCACSLTQREVSSVTSVRSSFQLESSISIDYVHVLSLTVPNQCNNHQQQQEQTVIKVVKAKVYTGGMVGVPASETTNGNGCAAAWEGWTRKSFSGQEEIYFPPFQTCDERSSTHGETRRSPFNSQFRALFRTFFRLWSLAIKHDLHIYVSADLHFLFRFCYLERAWYTLCSVLVLLWIHFGVVAAPISYPVAFSVLLLIPPGGRTVCSSPSHCSTYCVAFLLF